MVDGNHKPKISGTDHAIWRRPLMVEFPITIPKGEQDGELADRLMDEALRVLRWLLEGCLEWQKVGLKPPASVSQATEAYRLEMDVVGRFIRSGASPTQAYRQSSAISTRRTRGGASSKGAGKIERGLRQVTCRARVRSRQRGARGENEAGYRPSTALR